MIDESDNTETSKYTQEQKIIAAVWVHERFFNNQTWTDINRNFRARFNLSPPMRATLLNWEKKLFSQGNVEDKEKSGRPLARLMHVPYVKASLEESPELSLRERAKILGLPRTTLLKILREDLDMEFEVDEEGHNTDSNKRHLPYNNGRWKKKKSEDEYEVLNENSLKDDLEIKSD
ncbi:hypothetical protein RI129_007698 [Pyrocoelia pectoralis]|uniref:DUF4817 domain-containing protein n=1 Tax=Pyrocoelia pectoralis TaxID=417401 RepID=A0AAN7ZLP2_9COLE